MNGDTQKRLELATVRPSLQEFAVEMERYLQETSFKDLSWWQNTDSAFLFVKILNEVDELQSLFSMDSCNMCYEAKEQCKKCTTLKPDGCDEKVLSIALLCFMLRDKKEVQ